MIRLIVLSVIYTISPEPKHILLAKWYKIYMTKVLTIILINCFREWFVSMHSVDTNWYSLVQLINKYVLCYILAYGDILSV